LRAALDEELQGRAVAIALQYPGVLDGGLEDSWHELWLRLGQELGWQDLDQIDADVLRDEIGMAVESERLRLAGWSPEQLKEHSRALVAWNRLRPGETFDVSGWVGPLLSRRPRQRLEKHPASKVSWRGWDLRWIQPEDPPSAEELEATLTALGAPPICRAVRLPTLLIDLRWFDPGSRLPLRLALEIAFEVSGSLDLILLCLPGCLGYYQTHDGWCSVVHRPLSESELV